jgi:hypothetical protein
MRLLQGQNTKRVIAKKMNIVENKKNNYANKNEDHSEEIGDYVSILLPNIVGQGQDIASSSSVPVPNDAIPIPYDIHQKASNTLDTENTLNVIGDDSNKNKNSNEKDIVINL